MSPAIELKTRPRDALSREIELAMHSLVRKPNYPCVAAIHAMTTGDYEIHAYDQLPTYEQTGELFSDLLTFIQTYQKTQSPYLTFIASFDSPRDVTELEFENILWEQLSLLDHLSSKRFPWDQKVSADPNSTQFCLSLGGHAFFVVGMHQNSSRLARQFPYPTLVFNLYDQFEELKRRGQYISMVNINRKRDLGFQGSINPMLTEFGEDAEALQYSGRKVVSNWKCPFAHSKD